MKRALRVVVTLAVLIAWGAYLWRNWSLLVDYEWQLNPYALAIAFLLAMLYWFGLAWAWQRTLLFSGGSLTAVAGVYIWVRSMLARYLPGNVWHVFARLYLAEEEGEERAPVFASTVLEQILTLVGALLILAVAAPFMDPTVVGYLGLLLLIPFALIAIHPFFLNKGASFLARVMRVPGNVAVGNYNQILGLLLLYAGANLIAGLALWFVVLSMGATSLSFLPVVVGAFGAAWAAGYLSFLTPSGIGVREGVLTLLLAPAVGLPLATAAAILCRLLFTLGELGALAVATIGVKYNTVRRKRFV